MEMNGDKYSGGYGSGFGGGNFGGRRNFGGNRNGPRMGGGGFAPVKVGDELDVKIEAVGGKGDGIAKKNGFVLFVPGVKEGDEVHIRVTKVLKKVGFAEVVGNSQKKSQEQQKEYEKEEEEESEEDLSGEDSEDFGEESEEESDEISDEEPEEDEQEEDFDEEEEKVKKFTDED
ncbi:MAG: TRAM domain-containing protein [Candidatus Woesearchaeota archaeon]